MMIAIGVILCICAVPLLIGGIYVLVTSGNLSLAGKKNARELAAILIALGVGAICVALYCFGCFNGIGIGGSSSGGNGITTCKNCGRKASLDELTGYCKKCNESFWEWADENYFSK